MTSLTAQIAAGNDDAIEQGSDGLMTLDGTAIINNIIRTYCITRWQITGPNSGDTISAATIDVNVKALYDDPDLTFTGDDADNSAQPTSTAYDISNRTNTTASVSWSATSIGSGWNTSPDISSIIQEIINRPGWVSGNYLSIIWTWVANQIRFTAYDSTPANAAKLNITYTAAGSIIKQSYQLINPAARVFE